MQIFKADPKFSSRLQDAGGQVLPGDWVLTGSLRKGRKQNYRHANCTPSARSSPRSLRDEANDKFRFVRPTTRWNSDVTDCPEIDQDYLEMQKKEDLIRYRQDFLCEFIQPADRLTDMETIQKMIRSDIEQWTLPPLFHDHIPAPPKPKL